MPHKHIFVFGLKGLGIFHSIKDNVISDTIAVSINDHVVKKTVFVSINHEDTMITEGISWLNNIWPPIWCAAWSPLPAASRPVAGKEQKTVCFSMPLDV